MLTFFRAAMLLCIAVLVLAPTESQAQIFEVAMSSFFGVTPDPIQTAQSPESANNACVDAGGSLVADHNEEVVTQFVGVCSRSGWGSLCSSFTDGSAKPEPANLLQCVEGRPLNLHPSAPNSERCYYRWRFGFFDSLAFEDPTAKPKYFIPGTCYYTYLYRYAGGNNQVWNGFRFSPWNTSNALYSGGYPHGFFQTMGGVALSTLQYMRMDTPVPAEDYNPNPLSSFYVICSVQSHFLPERGTSTKIPQPGVVLDKGPWVRANWWVLFLIGAVVVVLVTLLLLWCCTRRILEKRAKQEGVANPVENSLIVRERKGSAYINITDDAEEEQDDEVQPIVNPRRAPPPQQQQQPMYGAGVMYQPMMDPTDAIQSLPRVYSQSDVSMMSEANAFADEEFVDEEGNEALSEDRQVLRRVTSTRSMEDREAAEGGDAA